MVTSRQQPRQWSSRREKQTDRVKGKRRRLGREPQPGGEPQTPSASQLGGTGPLTLSALFPHPPKGTPSLFLHPPFIPDVYSCIPPLLYHFGYFHLVGFSSIPSSSLSIPTHSADSEPPLPPTLLPSSTELPLDFLFSSILVPTLKPLSLSSPPLALVPTSFVPQ